MIVAEAWWWLFGREVRNPWDNWHEVYWRERFGKVRGEMTVRLLSTPVETTADKFAFMANEARERL